VASFAYRLGEKKVIGGLKNRIFCMMGLLV